MTIKEFVHSFTCQKSYIDIFCDESLPNWAKFDSELGYSLKSSIIKDGIDDSYTISNYEPGGERFKINYAKKFCRINTYGDSFTQCHQVSDGETWQEYLAAHFGEPIRNFGVGGYGVYQAYRKMLRHETNPLQKAENIILNIFSDDHFRSIDKWRWIRIEMFRNEIKERNPYFFHANPWCYIRINPDTAEFEELPSLCMTKDSLYNLCDEEYLYNLFKDDLIVHLMQAKNNGEFDKAIVKSAADLLGIQCDFSDADKTAATGTMVHSMYALESSKYLIKKTDDFCRLNGKKLMIVLSHGVGEIYAEITGQKRFDENYVDFLTNCGFCFTDLIDSHKKDFRQYKITPAEYVNKYYVSGAGHYNPRGNHFCAFEIKDKIISMLSPKPPAYRYDNEAGASRLASLLA